VLQSLDERASLTRLFRSERDTHGATAQWKANADRYLAVCKAHGAAYAFHHQRLVKAYVETPSKTATNAHSAGVTSSGPPLGEVMSMLDRLMDMRTRRPDLGI
jgi:Domain of unknown function (DUF1864)